MGTAVRRYWGVGAALGYGGMDGEGIQGVGGSFYKENASKIVTSVGGL
jgi:hypothetical protein